MQQARTEIGLRGLEETDARRQMRPEERLGAGRSVGHPAGDVGKGCRGEHVLGNVAQEGGVEAGGLLPAQRRHQPRLGAARNRSLRHDGDGTAHGPFPSARAFPHHTLVPKRGPAVI